MTRIYSVIFLIAEIICERFLHNIYTEDFGSFLIQARGVVALIITLGRNRGKPNFPRFQGNIS